MKATFHRTIGNDFAQLGGLMESATEFLASHQVDAPATYRINLALEEMVTNIIKYGYDAPGRHSIEVTLEIGPEEVTALIVDDGHPFNPLLQKRKRPADKLEDREIGGLGIDLVKKLLDRIDYRREGNRNILEVGAKRGSMP